jgi:hypothetical protein
VAVAGGAPAWVRQLVLAADQFIVRRPLAGDPEALTVIAGYHWFGDWGRDTMIALPGLTLATGRPEVARRVLSTFARFADGGMLPNVFPDAGTAPEYNTVDAALWYVEAVRQYVDATGDAGFLAEVFPVLDGIVEGHVRGTRHGIAVDPRDGLLAAGEPGRPVRSTRVRRPGLERGGDPARLACDRRSGRTRRDEGRGGGVRTSRCPVGTSTTPRRIYRCKRSP